MRVKTLSKEGLQEHATLLAKMVATENDSFDAIVGIRRGGSIVCDAFCQHFPDSAYRMRSDISKQRPSTKKKKGFLAKILKCLPIPILNLMRMIESEALLFKHRYAKQTHISEVIIPDELETVLGEKKCPRILLIDDAIDSGDTLYSVVSTLKKLNPSVGVKIAVITVTTKSPRVFPDYYIYNNRTLIRFPWSNDFKK